MNGDDGITTTELPAQRAAADQISKRTRSARHSEERTQQPQQPQEERQPPRQPTFNVVAAQSTAHKHSCYNKATSDMADQLDDINHLFHINFMESMQLLNAREKRYKNGTRKSCTFTNEQMRQIERENRILLNKILAQRPNSGVRRPMDTPHERARASSASRISSAAINRRQQQEHIDFVNNILRKKIEKIALRNPKQ